MVSDGGNVLLPGAKQNATTTQIEDDVAPFADDEMVMMRWPCCWQLLLLPVHWASVVLANSSNAFSCVSATPTNIHIYVDMW